MIRNPFSFVIDTSQYLAPLLQVMRQRSLLSPGRRNSTSVDRHNRDCNSPEEPADCYPRPSGCLTSQTQCWRALRLLTSAQRDSRKQDRFAPSNERQSLLESSLLMLSVLEWCFKLPLECMSIETVSADPVLLEPSTLLTATHLVHRTIVAEYP